MKPRGNHNLRIRFIDKPRYVLPRPPRAPLTVALALGCMMVTLAGITLMVLWLVNR